MFNLKEFRSKRKPFIDRLTWAALVAPGVVLNKTGSLMKTVEIVGYDLEVASDYTLEQICASINNTVSRFSNGWALNYDIVREETVSYPDSTFPNKVSMLVDCERKQAFLEKGSFFESKIYLTITWLPPESSDINDYLLSGNSQHQGYGKEMIEIFLNGFYKALEMLQESFMNIYELTDEQMLSYLHRTVSTKKHNVKVPDNPVYLDYLLADCPIQGGFEPKIGNEYIQVLSIRDFPSTSFASMLNVLNLLDLEFRWTTRWIALDKRTTLRELKKRQKNWFVKRVNYFKLVAEAMGMNTDKEQAKPKDADDKFNEIDDAIDIIEKDQALFGYYTTTIIVSDKDKQRCKAKIQKIEGIINNRGFTCVVEQLNAMEAYLGSIPGHTYANLRLPMLHSGNLSHLLAISSAWAGKEENTHFKEKFGDGAPLFIAQTIGASPFRAVFHEGDVGHSSIYGPAGSGKTTLMNLSALQFQRYENAKVIIFDKGYGAMVPTYAVGGRYIDLVGEFNNQRSRLQPLVDIDTVTERRWALGWLEALLECNSFKISVNQKNKLSSALKDLSGLPRECRTLSGLETFVADSEVREALQPYVGDGEYASTLDGAEDLNIDANWICFEMSELLSSSRAILIPTISAIFRKIRKSFDGRPVLVILDEAWEFLSHPFFKKQIVHDLKTQRKNNVSIWLMTQSVADTEDPEIYATLRGECPNRVFLANKTLKDDQLKDKYLQMGLNNTQIEIIENATPKKHYFFDSPSGNRLIDLKLDEIALSFCGSSGVEVARVATKILNQYGPENFAKQWLEHKGVNWAAKLLNNADFNSFMEKSVGDNYAEAV